ncbi:MAG: hypothetical protein QM726_16830 [Chitinophagaceae bacterium]
MLLKTRTFIILSSFSFLFSSCLTAKKLDRKVAKEYADRANLVQPLQNTDPIVISSPLIDQSEQFSVSKTTTEKMLPLVLYWSWQYKNSCTLNSKIPVNMLLAQLKKSGQLKDKLAGRKLELTIDDIPNKFAIIDKAHLVLFLFGWDEISIRGDAANLTIKYKLLQDGAAIKSGEITVPALANMRGIGMFTSWKTATSDFLQRYDANIAAMGKTLIANLLKEL